MDKHNKEKLSTISRTLRILALLSHIGITMAASVAAGVLLGRFLDDLLGTTPWLLLVFSLLGVGAPIKVLLNISEDKK